MCEVFTSPLMKLAKRIHLPKSYTVEPRGYIKGMSVSSDAKPEIQGLLHIDRDVKVTDTCEN